MTAPIVRVRGLTRRFTVKGVLNGVDLDIRKGEFVALLGRSGCGKSTLLRALAGIDHEAAGEGEIFVPDRISVAFQDARLLPWKRVLDNVVLGLTTPAAKDRGRAALAEVELAGREASWPFELSGGEQQRVALARSLVREPELLLADEPFGALDALTRAEMQLWLAGLWQREPRTALLITHDVREAVLLSDRIYLLSPRPARAVREIAIDLPRPRGLHSLASEAARAAEAEIFETLLTPERTPP
jgi:sulfonate transport system ATP-binding protein